MVGSRRPSRAQIAETPTTPTPAPEPSTPVVTVTVQGTTTPQARPQVTSSDVLDTAGLGPLQLNLPFSVLKDRGYIVATPADPCLPWQTSKQLRDLGVEVQLYYPDNHLGEIALTTATIKTRSGATVVRTENEFCIPHATEAIRRATARPG